jgi:hypothetical protein
MNFGKGKSANTAEFRKFLNEALERFRNSVDYRIVHGAPDVINLPHLRVEDQKRELYFMDDANEKPRNLWGDWLRQYTDDIERYKRVSVDVETSYPTTKIQPCAQCGRASDYRYSYLQWRACSIECRMHLKSKFWANAYTTRPRFSAKSLIGLRLLMEKQNQGYKVAFLHPTMEKLMEEVIAKKAQMNKEQFEHINRITATDKLMHQEDALCFTYNQTAGRKASDMISNNAKIERARKAGVVFPSKPVQTVPERDTASSLHYHRILNNKSEAIWFGSGRETYITEMADPHLINTMKFLLRHWQKMRDVQLMHISKMQDSTENAMIRAQLNKYLVNLAQAKSAPLALELMVVPFIRLAEEVVNRFDKETLITLYETTLPDVF